MLRCVLLPFCVCQFALLFSLLHFPTQGDLVDRETFQKTQNLAIGACAMYDEDFCSRQVENSVCNKAKNECFCRKDYVAIRENGRVTCKTLLTDLRCRVDRDCIHVNRSSCHPGAGYCSCPGSTIYVPQLHACRNRADYAKSPACKSCQKNNGVCFFFEKYDLTEYELRFNAQRIGCVCPGGKTASAMQSEDWYENICGGELVDIGFECNQRDKFCRSKNAVCKPVDELLTRSNEVPQNLIWPAYNGMLVENYISSQDRRVSVCQCRPGSIPVYQTTLGYSECFTKLSGSSPRCKGCTRMNGECYDLNGDDIGDGCNCPPHRSTPTEGGDSNLHLCEQLHVSVNCTDGYFSVCYTPHTQEPYKTLSSRLLDHSAVARLAPPTYHQSPDGMYDRSSKAEGVTSEFRNSKRQWISKADPISVGAWISDMCELSQQGKCPSSRFELFETQNENFASSPRFCFHEDVWRTDNICGIRIYKLGSLIQYEAILEIMVNRSFRTPNKDLQLPLKCIAQAPRRSPVVGTKSYNFSYERIQNVAPVILSLRVLNEENKEVPSVNVNSNIRLDALLEDPTGVFKAVSVERCYYSNRSAQSTSFNLENQIPFILHGCPVLNPKILTKFTNHRYPSSHVQSNTFTAFRTGTLASVFFRCLLKVCKNVADCEQDVCNSTEITRIENAGDVTKAVRNEFFRNGFSAASTLLLESPLMRTQNSTILGDYIYVERWSHTEVQTATSLDGLEKNDQYEPFSVMNTVPDSSSLLLNLPAQPLPAAVSRSPVCEHTLCLTATQLVWIATGMISVMAMMGLVGYGTYKKCSGVKNDSKSERMANAKTHRLNCCSQMPGASFWIPNDSCTGQNMTSTGPEPTEAMYATVLRRKPGIVTSRYPETDMSLIEANYRATGTGDKIEEGSTHRLANIPLIGHSEYVTDPKLSYQISPYCYCNQHATAALENAESEFELPYQKYTGETTGGAYRSMVLQNTERRTENGPAISGEECCTSNVLTCGGRLLQVSYFSPSVEGRKSVIPEEASMRPHTLPWQAKGNVTMLETRRPADSKDGDDLILLSNCQTEGESKMEEQRVFNGTLESTHLLNTAKRQAL